MSDRSTARAEGPRVVVGIDGSDASLRALDLAADEAGARGAVLELLCATGWPRRSAVPVTEADTERMRVAAADVVDAAAERARERVPGLRTVPSLPGDAVAGDALLHAGRDASLTVVGTRGHGGFAGLLVGSVSLHVAARSAGPVLVVGEGAAGAHTEHGSVLVGLHTESDGDALRCGFETAARRDSDLHVLHAWARPRMPGRLQLPPHEAAAAGAAAAKQVQAAIAPFSAEHPEVRVTAEEKGGSPAATLIEASRASDVIVLAVHRHQQRKYVPHLGPVAHAVLHHAHCPVLLVPTD